MEGGGAYGAGRVTGDFDVIAYIKKPQVILRSISWVFSIVVFGCISSQCWIHEDGVLRCAYGDASNCGFGTAVGVIAFLGLIVFLVIDAVFDSLSNVEQRRYLVIADIAFCGLWSFMWFVCFCLLTNKWQVQEKKHLFHGSGVQAAIAFSFFSIITFIALTVLAILRYRKGISEDFLPTDYDPSVYGVSSPGTENAGNAPYQSSGESYTQSPFAAPQESKPMPGGYQQQTY